MKLSAVRGWSKRAADGNTHLFEFQMLHVAHEENAVCLTIYNAFQYAALSVRGQSEV